MEDPGRASLGWGVVTPDLSRIPVVHPNVIQGRDSSQQTSEVPGSSTSGPALPPDLIQAFLQSHKPTDDGPVDSQVLSSAASIDSYDGEAATSSMSQPHLPNPFAGQHIDSDLQQQPQPLTSNIASRYPALPKQPQSGTPAAAAGRGGKPKRRSLLRRLLRALAVTGASAGLIAAGAWAGTAAYRHYMAQLDDRDQLARRVEKLEKQENKLTLRCTALEQERNDLKDKVSDLSQAVADSNLAKTELKQQLKSTSADRDEAVRHNLKLQSKLSSLEDDYSGLIQVNKEAMRELDESRAQVDKLNKEAGQLSALVEKLENRCSHLESANSRLKEEHASLAAQHRKQQTAL